MGVELITDSGRHYSARTTDAFTETGRRSSANRCPRSFDSPSAASSPSGTGYNFWLGLDDVMVVFAPELSEEIGVPEPS